MDVLLLLVQYLVQTLLQPIIFYFFAFLDIISAIEEFEAPPTYSIYILLFPFIFLFLLFQLRKRLPLSVRMNRFYLPLILLLVMQLVPLPRSEFTNAKGIDDPNPRSEEPRAIGLGYPFSLVKYFLGDGCLDGGRLNSGRGYQCDNTLDDFPGVYKVTPTESGLIAVVHRGDIALFAPGLWYTFSVWLYPYLFWIIINDYKSRRQPDRRNKPPRKNS